MANIIERIKQLINLINKANEQYYGDDDSSLSDYEYDKLFDELMKLEEQTGIVFNNSPTKNIGSSTSNRLKKVEHTKPMLSAKKTKSYDELYDFVNSHESVASYKFDGLTVVLRYKEGQFYQALTRGEDGLKGEDVTHCVKYIKGFPKTVNYNDEFEVRGEGVISYKEFDLLNTFNNYSNPRNAASGLVRANHPDKQKLEHVTFVAFELIENNSKERYKSDQIDFLTKLGFNTIDYKIIKSRLLKPPFINQIKSFNPKNFDYPVDGVIVEINDLLYGKSLGATKHHENRLLAFKWQDELYETTFKGIELFAGKNGEIQLNALFDAVDIDGVNVSKANLKSYSNYEKLELGVGDKIQIHKANMVIPQVVDNLTKSNTYQLKLVCPCCHEPLEIKIKPNGIKQLCCPNEKCFAKQSTKIAKYCDQEAMNIEGLNASTIEKLLTYGIINNCADIYKLKHKANKILDIPKFSIDSFNNIVKSIENSRRCHLYQFLLGMDIPLMTYNAAKAIDDYFYGSFEKFEAAIENNFDFFHIADISETLHRNIYKWYYDKDEQIFYKPLLQEITFIGHERKEVDSTNIFKGANVVITGSVNDMDKEALTQLLLMFDSNVLEDIQPNVDYLIVGKNPDSLLVGKALMNKITILTEDRFIQLLSKSA